MRAKITTEHSHYPTFNQPSGIILQNFTLTLESDPIVQSWKSDPIEI
ncbi:hypothetical protein SPLC1_S542860 [Arthrospira platensis C1]|nr:hypothetical protein SPLC1_S542860 [Arthrospira platensis C1]